MIHMLNNMEEILSQQISGLHQYILNDPVHISYVSQNLCEMLGISETELLHETQDLYASLVHPADLEKYSAFIHKLASKEQGFSTEYRLIKKDGTIIFVKDTVTVKKQNNGILCGTSVLTDVTDIRNENNNLQFLNETIPADF